MKGGLYGTLSAASATVLIATCCVLAACSYETRELALQLYTGYMSIAGVVRDRNMYRFIVYALLDRLQARRSTRTRLGHRYTHGRASVTRF